MLRFSRRIIQCSTKPSLLNQTERKLSQIVLSTSRVSPVNTFLQPSITNINAIIGREFHDEEETDGRPKKKKQKHNPQAVEHVGRLDLRVGTIVEVNKAPDADTLYLIKIDIGRREHRSVVAGLTKFFTEDELRGRNVVVLCNLKASKLRGHLSEAMIMCASNGDTTELLQPPDAALPGDLVHCETYERVPVENPRDKKKLFDSLAPDMSTNDALIACYKGSYLHIPDKGNIVTKSLKNAKVS